MASDAASGPSYPYGNGETSEKIHKIIKEFLFDKEINLKKKFYNIKFDFYFIKIKI